MLARRTLLKLALLTPLGASLGCARRELSVPPGAPVKGAKRPKLIIQELGDFECPFCADVQPVLEEVLHHYGEQVKIVWRDYPLTRIHPHAMGAAEAAREVRAQLGEAGFWRFHRVLFARQGALARPQLETYAEGLGGVDLDRFRTAMNQEAHRPAIEREVAEVDSLGIDRVGTPGFFIGEDVLFGAHPFATFRDLIQPHLS